MVWNPNLNRLFQIYLQMDVHAIFINLVSYAASKFSIPDGIDKFTKDINYHFCINSTEEATSKNIKNILVLIITLAVA